MAHHPAPESHHDPVVDQDGSTLRPSGASPIGASAAAVDAEEDRDERLGEAIEAYLERAEGGHPPDPAEFATNYPDLGDDLVAALEGLALVKGLVGGPVGPGHRLEEGRRVAGYRIVREIGRGGMGVVYEAVHVGLDRPVALKVLGSQAAPDSSGRRRFLNEARTAAGLHHTHIVPVFDVGQVGGLCYYAMQRIEGSGLDRVLRALRRDRTVASGSTAGSSLRPSKASERGSSLRTPGDPRPILPPLPVLGDETLSWAGGNDRRPPRWRGEGDRDEAPAFAPPRGSGYYRWVARVGMQAAEALAHAHQRGIIHRDIKPSNLLVDARGTVWVADFGLARRLADPSQTQVDSLLGTPRYMSPEQARTGAIDGRADVYSLGATLYELITLRPPFDGQTAAELIDQITGREPLRPRRFDPRVPLDLETILLKALSKRPADRYAGAAALAEDLGRFLSHEPVRARRIGPVGRAWRFARRHPGASTVSALAATVVLTTATVAYVHIVGARNRADDQAQVATRALQSTEVAVAELRMKNQELQAAALDNLEKQAANTRLVAATNRRAEGLDVIRQAVALAGQMKPDPALSLRLRDQAAAFLTTRDVQERPAIPTPNRPRRDLAFGPTGQRIAALDIDGELSVWDAAQPSTAESSQRPIAPRWGGRGGRQTDRVLGDRIAQAGDQVAVICPQRDGIWWFDLAAPDKPVGRKTPIPNQKINSILCSDDGRRFLTIGDAPAFEQRGRVGPEPVICLWDRQQPEAPLATLSPPARRSDDPSTRFFLLAALAPDGSRAALAYSDDGRVALFDAAGRPLEDGTGAPIEPIKVEGTLRALALGPSGLLAIAESGGEVALWDLNLNHPKQLPTLDLHQGFVNLLRFSPRDGTTLAIASNGGVELWDLATRSPIVALPTTEFVADLAFAPDGRTLAVAEASRIALWSLIEPTAQVALPESTDEPNGLAFGPGGLLAVATRDGNFEPAPLQLWGGPDRCPDTVAGWTEHRPSIAGFDALGRLICLEHDAVRWFRPPANEPEAELLVPYEPRLERRGDRRGDGPGPGASPPPPRSGLNTNMIRTHDGLTLLLQRGPNAYYLWRHGTDAPLTPLEFGDWTVELWRRPLLAGSGDALRLFYIARRGDLLACRSLAGRGFGRLDWSTALEGASSLALAPDGSTLAVGFATGRVELRDPATGRLRASLTDPNKNDAGPAQALAFSPDGQVLAVGGRKHVRLWSVGSTPEPLVRLPGYRSTVRHLAFDLEGARLAAADDKAVKVWNLAQLRDELARLGLAWGPSGARKF